MVELVRFLVESLVDKPEEVKIAEVKEADAIIIEVRVAQDDMGKIIGKNGRIAKAVRSIVKAGSTNQKQQYYVKII